VNPSDVRAAKYFQELSWERASRVLVLNGAARYAFPYPQDESTPADLYDCTPGAIMSITLMQYGGMAIPLGYDYYGHPDEYNPVHTKANENLDQDALRQLRIQYVYTDAHNQTTAQRATLESMLRAGQVKVVYDLDQRQIYEVTGVVR
jgi:hypothetical protein